MVSLKRRRYKALEVYNIGLGKITKTSPPKDQKFPNDSKVRIVHIDGSETRSHFKTGVYAVVQHTYAQLYGNGSSKLYRVKINGTGKLAWYKEHQLRAVLL